MYNITQKRLGTRYILELQIVHFFLVVASTKNDKYKEALRVPSEY